MVDEEVTRRDLLQTSLLAGAGAMALAAVDSRTEAVLLATPRKRKSITSLSAAEIAAWRAGVQVMKARSLANPADPTGWLFQANIHGASPATTFSNKCQYGH